MKYQLFCATALLAALQSPLFGQITVEPWHIHEGTEGIIDHPTHTPEQFKQAFEKAKIPTDGWIPVPLEDDGTINFNPGSSITKPKGQVDFTYFKTAVTVGKEEVKDFKLTFGLVDDAARIYLNGEAIPEADIIGRKQGFKTIDLKEKIKPGRNEIVVVQFDQHPPGNTLKNLGLEVNGEDIVATGGSLTVTPGQVHKGNEPQLVEFETRTLDQRKEAFTKADIPAQDAEGWEAAEIRKDNKVVYSPRSEVKKSAAQLDFTYFQTIVTLPAEKPKTFQVQHQLIDDGARIYLFNSKHPKGYYDADADVFQLQHKLTTADFTDEVVEGENRVVLVHFDQSGPGTSMMGLHLILTE